MVIYVMLLAFCLFLGFLMDKFKNRTNNNYKYLSLGIFLALFTISAIRFEVGKDYTDTYVFTYNQILEHASNVRMDIAFMVIYKIMYFFKANVQWIFIITSFIINWFICKSVNEQSENCQLSLWIYICGIFYFFSMNGVRQSVAISLFYYSLKYIKNKELKKYFILNGLGCLFHSSAIIFFPLYFILGRKYKFKTKLIVAIGIFVGSNVIITLLSYLLLQTKYSMYLTNGAYSAHESINFSMVLNIILFLLYEWNLSKKSDEMSIIYSNIHYIGIIVTLFATSLPLIIRVFVYFRFIEFLSVPNLINIQSRKRYRQVIILVVFIIYFAYFIWGVFIKNGNTVLPYQTIFSQI